ncbi:D-2-hydroxyacid dehydrogenase [Pseudolabrys taiwanensis]|uniref:D-2-hydroxyacid dehydrogenase n=1 Tax=Pseudolabrys taiwanensis TaxID=331696 RepID=A0A345ZS53_9HYPH|nr:D-2-hydroxyacid dehydrogenase [Pseudolabrys taiwanensis]AXK79750.1 D-2-hydroxyacid dehydrogenase [Pseudolabrys taiwanensis]
MPIMVMDRGLHIDAGEVRKAFPQETVRDARDAAEALGVCADCEVLVAMAHDVTDELVGAMPRLKYICAMSAGTDRLDTLKNLKADVRITSGRGIHGPQMSELAFLGMIALSREFPRMQQNQRARRWERWPQKLLFGKTVLLVGIGPIAEELALRCEAFGLRVLGVSDARKEAPHFAALYPRSRLKEAAALADFMIVLVPLSDKTRHMIDAEVLAAMKPTGIIVNLARGPVIDEQALIKALQEKRIGGAALDVFETEPPVEDNPLWDMPNVIITPRIGGMSDVYAQQVLPLVVHNLRCFLDGRPSEMKNILRG